MPVIYQDFEIEIEKTKHGEYVLKNKIGGVSMDIALDSKSIIARINRDSGNRLQTEARDNGMTLRVSA